MQQYSKLNIDQGRFLVLRNQHPSPSEYWNVTQCIMQPVFTHIKMTHFLTTSAVASISNSDTFPWQWQVIQLLPPGPIGKIPLMHQEKSSTFLSESLNLQPEPEWKDCRILYVPWGTAPDWRKGIKACSSNSSSIPCGVSAHTVFFMICNMVYRLCHSSILC